MLPKFDAENAAFTIENAYVLMRANQATYAEDNTSYFERLEELGIDRHDQQWIASRFDACFIGWTNDWAVLAFRGTDNPGGWLSNLYGARPVARSADYYGKVHRGFADGLDALWTDLFAKLSTVELKDKPLFVTGHSRGGALATLAAQSLWYQGIKPVAVYTYGCPRVGNSGFADRYDIKHHYRIENDRDIVPHVPPPRLFSHVGVRYWLDSAGDLQAPEFGETPASPLVNAALEDVARVALSRVATPILGDLLSQGLLAPEFITDHANTAYAYWLWKQLPDADRLDAGKSTYP